MSGITWLSRHSHFVYGQLWIVGLPVILTRITELSPLENPPEKTIPITPIHRAVRSADILLTVVRMVNLERYDREAFLSVIFSNA